MNMSIYTNDRNVLCGEINGILLHSRRNPLKESEKILRRLFPDPPPGLIIIGVGLGYYNQVIEDLYPGLDVVCVEPHPDWLGELKRHGVNIKSSSTIYTSDQDWESIIKDKFYEGYELFIPESYRRIFPEMISSILEIKNAFTNREQINTNTLKRFGSRWIQNLLTNFMRLEEDRSINIFKNRAKGLPALLLAGGPSLTAVLPQLKNLSRKMYVLAVDTAFSVCRAAGVEPDFVIAVDPQYWNTKHLEDITRSVQSGSTQSKSAILISEFSASPRTFRLNNEHAYFIRSLFPLGNFLEEQLQPRDSIGSGGSVATSAWDFLRYLGCKDIYCAGLDLGFPDRQTHFKGSYFEESIAGNGTRLRPCEQQSLEYLNSGQLAIKEDYSGNQLLSDKRMDIYCAWFENQVKNNLQINTYSLSSKSRRLRGFSHVDVNDLLELSDVRDQINSSLLNIEREAPAAVSTEKIENNIATLIVSLETIEKQCRHAKAILDDYQPKIQDEENRKFLLKELDSIDNSILSDHSRKIAGFLINDIMDKLSKMTAAGNLDEALDRSRVLYSSLLKGTETTVDLVKRISKRFKNSAESAENNIREKTPLD